MSKYHAKKTTTMDGITHDSRKEARRWEELCLLQKAGEISSLKRQVKFLLIPAQRDSSKLLERECSYIADFVYTDRSGLQVVEDVKGVRTPAYTIKRKLMLYFHGIRIREI